MSYTRILFLMAYVGYLFTFLVHNQAVARDQLVIGITQFPATLNPNINSMLAKSYVLNMALRPFTTYDQNWNLICLLCTELPTIENGLAKPETLPNGDTGVRITYTIQPKARWGDGRPVTTSDVIFTWEVGRHQKAGFSGLEGYRRILDVEAIDDKTFSLLIDRLSYNYNALNNFYIIPSHLETAAFAEPSEYRHRTTYDTEPSHPGLYFGPYKIVSVESGAEIVLERNRHWFGSEPYFKRIVVRVIENTAALEANLLSGAIDYIAGELGFTIEQALSFDRRKGDGYNTMYKSGLIYEHLDINLENPIFADRRVRQALVYSLNRSQLVSQLFGGRQTVAHTNISPLDRIHSEDVPIYSYDLNKASELLDSAGWTVFRDGIRHNSDGTRLSFQLMTTAGNKSRELVQQVLQSQWREAGIEAIIRNEPARVFFGETMTKRANKGLSMYAWLSTPESLPLTTLRSDNIPSSKNGWSGQNYPGYSIPEMDKLIDKIEAELDPEIRLPLWAKLQHLYATDLPAIPLFFRAEAYFFPKWLKGVRPTGHMSTTTTWVEEWTAEKE